MKRWAMFAGAILAAAILCAAPVAAQNGSGNQTYGPRYGRRMGVRRGHRMRRMQRRQPTHRVMGYRGAPGMGGMDFEHHLPPPYAGILIMHREMLGLSDDQVSRLKTILTDQMKNRIRGKADIQIAFIDLMQMLHQPNPDRGKIDSAVRDIGRRLTDLGLADVHSYLDARAVLTPAQLQKMQGMGSGMGMGMGAGMGPCHCGAMMGGAGGGMPGMGGPKPPAPGTPR